MSLSEAINKANQESKKILNESRKKHQEKFDAMCDEISSMRERSTNAAQENEQFRIKLANWQATLQSANQKLIIMKELHCSAERKIYRVIQILENKYPDAKKHFRYLRNKVKGMAHSYSDAKCEFANLNDVNHQIRISKNNLGVDQHGKYLQTSC